MRLIIKHIFVLVLMFSISSALKAQSSSITLQIVSDGTNITVDSAEVQIVDTKVKAMSNRNGNVKITGLSAGIYLLSIKHPDYDNTTISLNLSVGQDHRQRVTLIPQLDEVVVTEDRVDQFLEDQGFNHRKEVGFGTYITREEVKRKGRLDMTDVIRGIPGVRLKRYNSRLIASVNRSPSKNSSGPCALDIYLDGYNVGGNPPDLNAIATPAEVAAVEVYKGASTLPARFNRFNSCGAIVIWTKMRIKDDEANEDGSTQ